MKNRFIAFFISVLLLCMPMPFSALSEDIVINITEVNGERGENEMILYNLHGEFTETNEWGYEIVVTNGFVTAVGENNSFIPDGENSFVISAHGTAVESLLSVSVGMKAVYSSLTQTVSFLNDSETLDFLVDRARNDAITAKNTAYDGCLVISDSADARFSLAEERYNSAGENIDSYEATRLIAEYEQISVLYRERSATEYRGIWIRPLQRSLPEVEHFVRKCHEAGINMISVEAIYDCTAICPMPENSYFEHNPYFEGFDVLKAFSQVCRKYGVELHCWMHVFSVGDENSKNNTLSVTYKKPEWRVCDSEGKYNSEFLNPALDEVQDFLIENYKYILENYDIDAFQLDTIRYPAVENSVDYGYDKTTIELFKMQHSEYRASKINYNPQADYWQNFVTFRADCVSELVGRVRELIDEVAPEVLLTADVSAVLSDARVSRYQDTVDWLNRGWLDMVHPMAYGKNDTANVAEFFEYIEGSCAVVPALGVFVEDFDANAMLEQTCTMRDIGCYGVAYFAESEYFAKGCDELLKMLLFDEWAVPPSLNNANTAVAELNRFISRAETAYNRGFIDEQTKNDFKDRAGKAVSEITEKGTNSSSKSLNGLLSYVKASVPEGVLKSRFVLDITAAYNAVERNKTIDNYREANGFTNEVPRESEGVLRLTIDKINATHTGEDSVIFTDFSNIKDCNINFAYVMLLEPIDAEKQIYRLVESHRNYGTPNDFSNEFVDGMIAVSFHSDDFSEGAERRNLAETVEVGTLLVLWGIDVQKADYTAMNSMLYAYTEPQIPQSPEASEISDFASADNGTNQHSQDENGATVWIWIAICVLVASVVAVLAVKTKKTQR